MNASVSNGFACWVQCRQEEVHVAADREHHVIGYRKACAVRGIGLSHYVMLTGRLNIKDERGEARADRGPGYEPSR